MDQIVNTTKPAPNSLPGFYEPAHTIELSNDNKIETIDGIDFDDAFIIKNVLSSEDCQKLIEFMHTSNNFEDVGVQGMMDKKDERIGSKRTSIWSPSVAEQIWNKIDKYLPIVAPTQFTPTDWWQGKVDINSNKSTPVPEYYPVAVSPLLRFMQYGKGGQHYAHYDAGFIYPDNNYRTLKSMVIYLTTNDGAATRFINDQQYEAVWHRNHNDWEREVREDEIIGKSECIRGNILIFNHRVCHDVEKYMGGQPRIIIRGDIVYKMF